MVTMTRGGEISGNWDTGSVRIARSPKNQDQRRDDGQDRPVDKARKHGRTPFLLRGLTDRWLCLRKACLAGRNFEVGDDSFGFRVRRRDLVAVFYFADSFQKDFVLFRKTAADDVHLGKFLRHTDLPGTDNTIFVDDEYVFLSITSNVVFCGNMSAFRIGEVSKTFPVSPMSQQSVGIVERRAECNRSGLAIEVRFDGLDFSGGWELFHWPSASRTAGSFLCLFGFGSRGILLRSH